jgi:hypothetical protein
MMTNQTTNGEGQSGTESAIVTTAEAAGRTVGRAIEATMAAAEGAMSSARKAARKTTKAAKKQARVATRKVKAATNKAKRAITSKGTRKKTAAKRATKRRK